MPGPMDLAGPIRLGHFALASEVLSTTSSAAVKILLSAAKETAREMKDLKVLLTTMRANR